MPTILIASPTSSPPRWRPLVRNGRPHFRKSPTPASPVIRTSAPRRRNTRATEMPDRPTTQDTVVPKDRWQSYTDPVEAQFHESIGARVRRWVLGMAYALMPTRISLVPRLVVMTVAYWLRPKRNRDRLPENPVYYGRLGLIGISNDVNVETFIARYRKGWFPICHVGPMKWWSPEERAVIAPEDIRIEKRVRRLLRQNKFLVTFDEDFGAVVEASAAPRFGKTPLTWITPRIMHAYWALH